MSKSYRFVLYLFDELPEESAAYFNLRRLCEEYLNGLYDLKVVDLRTSPELANEKDIFATPTVDREAPEPVTRIVGDLSDPETAALHLGFKTHPHKKGN